MRVLVTGGAGYIGSHTVVQLAAAGHEPVIVDDFRNARSIVMERVTRLVGRPLVLERLEAASPTALDDVLHRHPVEAIIHFAGLKAAAESVTDRCFITGPTSVTSSVSWRPRAGTASTFCCSRRPPQSTGPSHRRHSARTAQSRRLIRMAGQS